MFKFMIVFLISAVTLFAESKLDIQPAVVKEFDKINITYTPDDRLITADYIKAFIYCFDADDNQPDAHEITLKDKGDEYFGEFKLPDNTVFGLVKIYGVDDKNTFVDNNFGNLWDFLVYGIDSRPVKNSYLKAALSYMGNQPENYMRNVDLLKAQKFLQKETKYHPKNTQAQIGYSTIQFDLKKINYDEYVKQLKGFLSNDYKIQNENDLKAISRVYRILNKKSKADQIEKKFAQDNPKSSLAEEVILAALSKASSFKHFTEFALNYFKLYPVSSNRDRILSAFSTSFLQMGKTKQLLEQLDKIKNVSIITYLQIANEIIDNEKILPKLSKQDRIETAQEIFSIAMLRLKREKQAPYVYKPKALTRTEWDNELKIIESIAYKTGGDIELKKGDSDKALDSYLISKKLSGMETNPEIYELLADLFMKQGKYNEAFFAADEGIRLSKSTEKLEALFIKADVRAKGLAMKMAKNDLEFVQIFAKRKRLKELKYEVLDKSAITGTFTRLNDTYEDLGDYRGQVMVLMMWATWCGPCQVMFPAYENLFITYTENDDVEIASINIWEQDSDRIGTIRKFLKETEANFPIFIDETDIFPRKIGVIGLPTIIVLDQNGKLQFQQTGYTSEDDFIRNIEDRIEFLLNRDEYE